LADVRDLPFNSRYGPGGYRGSQSVEDLEHPAPFRFAQSTDPAVIIRDCIAHNPALRLLQSLGGILNQFDRCRI